MEQHPVPRNISGFQFHLIGDMTLRQFGYLAGGGGAGYILYRIGPFPVIINVAIAGMCGLIGFAFAFLPIQDRPLDRWIVAFIRSILSPTQYLWRKENKPPDILTQTIMMHATVEKRIPIDTHKEAQVKLRAYLATLPTLPHESINLAEKQYIAKTLNLFQTAAVSSPVVHIPTPSFSPASQSKTASSSVSSVPLSPQPYQIKIESTKTVSAPVVQQSVPSQLQPHPAPLTASVPSVPKLQINPAPPFAQSVLPKTPMMYSTNQKETLPQIPILGDKTLEDKLKTLTDEKALLEQQLNTMKASFAQKTESQIVKPAPAQQNAEPTVKTVTAKQAVSAAGLPSLPGYPNIVIGVVKDPDMKLLPNIIITIKDKKGMPLRALKTNKLGQFAAATPLSDGTYRLELEDPLKRFVFDIPEIILTGKVFLPIEITAKGRKEIMRAQLTKEIFGGLPA